MTTNTNRRHVLSLRWLCLVATFALLSGCASYLEARRADQLIAEGDNEAGLVLLAQLAKTEPADYKLKYIRTRDGVLRDMLLAARRLRKLSALIRPCYALIPSMRQRPRGLPRSTAMHEKQRTSRRPMPP